MLPVNAIKQAVDSLSDDGKPKQEFIEKLERIFDQYPEQADELLTIVQEEISKTTLIKPVRTEVLTLLEQTIKLRIDHPSKQEYSPQNANNQDGSWNEFLESNQIAPTQLSTGAIIRNTYRLETLLGIGGMGEVWKATHLLQDDAESSDSDRFVAIKFLNIDFRKHPDALKSLAREFAYSRKLIHQNIVQVFELNHSDNQVYIAMEYLSGQPLNHWIKEHPQGVSLKNAIPIIRGICDALKFAHLHKFIHLDVKPSNIIYDPESEMVKVIDFGITRHANPIDRDKTSFDLGKLRAVTGPYASLEMLRSIDPDPRDDIYALACISYELLTGSHPYGRHTAKTALSKGLKPIAVPGLKSSQNSTLLKGLHLLRKRRIFDVEQFRDGLLPEYKNQRKLWGLSNRVILTALLMVGAILLAPTLIQTLLDMRLDPIRQGILVGKSSAAIELFRSPNDDQNKILAKKEVIDALLGIYTTNLEADPINEFEALTDPLRKRIYADSDFKNKLMQHYLLSIEKHTNQDAYPKAEELLDSISKIYPDSNQIAKKTRTLQIAKSQRLTQLARQLESCFTDHSGSLTKLSDCLVSNQTKILKIEPDKQLSLNKIDDWFNKSIGESLKQKKLIVGADLLKNWELIQNKDSMSRSVLRDIITIATARVSSLPQLWSEFAKSDANRRSQILNIKVAQEKLLAYVASNASLSAKQNDYPSAFNILNDAVDVIKNHSDSFSKLMTVQTALIQEHNEKIDRLKLDYLTKVKNCDLQQLKVREAIHSIGGHPLDGINIDQECIASIRNAIIKNDSGKVSNLFDHWKTISPKTPPEFKTLEIAKKIRFTDVELPTHLMSLASLPADQQQLALDIDPVQERLVNHFQQSAEHKITASGFPSALQFVNEMANKISHPATLTVLQQIHASIQKKQKRKIVTLLFEYQRQLLKCSDGIGLLQTQLNEVGANRPPFYGVDKNCFQKLQELLTQEDIVNAESILKTWRKLLPDNKTTYLQQRKLISEKLVDMKAQLKQVLNLSNHLRQAFSNNDEKHVFEIIKTQINRLSPANAEKFWVKNEKELSDYFIAQATIHLDKEDFSQAQHYCNHGISIYPRSATLQTNCKDLVETQVNQRVTELTKIFKHHLENGWLVTGVRYRKGVLGIFDEISKLDNSNSLLKSADVHSAFKKSLINAVKKMQHKEARILSDGWAKFFERKYTSNDAVNIRISAKNRSATYALTIARELIQENLNQQAKQLLQLGLELTSIASVTEQIENELTRLNSVQQ
ncbi:MAG: serine/threonine-protein kinase [Methylococcales bacterium]